MNEKSLEKKLGRDDKKSRRPRKSGTVIALKS